MKNYIEIKNCEAVAFDSVPRLTVVELGDFIAASIAERCRILSFFAMEDVPAYRLVAVVGNSATGSIRVASASVGDSYPSLTPRIPALHWFEREVAEQFAIVPEGHPWLKPIRSHGALGGRDAWGRQSADIQPGGGVFFENEGEAGHEVAVGPVHAGVIEPGHFRFQCVGEDVQHLEISLGYQHRGIEKLMEGGPGARSIHYAETAAGDSTIASAWCYAGVVEALSGCTVGTNVSLVRAVMLELERVANHVGDLGALSGDVAFLPTSSYCGRIRGEYLNMTAEIAGNRFGRNVVVPGGIRVGISGNQADKIYKWMMRVYPELNNALGLMFDEPSVLDRFEGTGTVDAAVAAEIGMTGVAGRASGLDIAPWRPDPRRTDSRPMTRPMAGDVLSRADVRYSDIRASHFYLFSVLGTLIDGEDVPVVAESVRPRPNMIAVSVTDAWRGELVHVAITGGDGSFRLYKITDPSFHNWFGLALALRGEQISNFPICNKSFNLSYCGHDL